MKAAIFILLWLLLLFLCWPLALAAILLVPLLWILSLPFRIVFWTVESLFQILKRILFLPARLLGFRPAR
jgi:hypothetical protein